MGKATWTKRPFPDKPRFFKQRPIPRIITIKPFKMFLLNYQELIERKYAEWRELGVMD